jgi:YggT family protein
MGGYFANAGVFLVQVLFGLYTLAVLLRLLLQIARADFYNPLAQALVKITNPPLLPLRRVIPGLFGIDLASVVLLLIVNGIKLLLVALILGAALNPLRLLYLDAVELLDFTLTVFLVAIFIRVILSWFNPYPNAATQLLGQLTEPLMRPARRYVPPIGGLDLSPMAPILLLVLAKMLIIQPLYDLAGAVGR